MQLLARIAYQLGQTGLDIHVHVFKLGLPDEFARFDFGPDRIKPPDQSFRFFGGDDALTAQHAGMGLRCPDILRVQGAVVGLRIGVGRDGLAGAFGKAAPPALICAHDVLSVC